MFTTFRGILWCLVGAAGFGLLYGLWAQGALTGNLNQQRATASQTEDNVVAASSTGPVFTLTNHHGKVVSQEDFLGRWMLVFFGFSHCPDVCPSSLADLAEVLDGLGGDRARIAPVFVSIDPARDNVDAIASFVAAFHADLIGLTGSDEQIKHTARSFRVYYERVEQDDAPDGYAMAHTAVTYLVSPEGIFEQTFAYGTAPSEILAVLQEKLSANEG